MFSVNAAIGIPEPIDLDNLPEDQTALTVKDLNLSYNGKPALFDINMRIPKGRLRRSLARPAAGNPHCYAVSTGSTI